MSENVTAARPYAKAIFELAKKGASFDAVSYTHLTLPTIYSV